MSSVNRIDPVPCFEIGLTMAGAVSAGAYTAGVLDYLLEALDKWYAAKNAGRADVPDHEVRIRVISGASAGALSAVILATNARTSMPPVKAGVNPVNGSHNPLFSAWVDLIDISELLKLNDIKQNQMPLSLLDTTVIDTIGSQIVRPHQSEVTRDFISNPLRVAVTLTNITGIPYSLPAQAVGTNQQTMVAHGDMMAFAVKNAGGAMGDPPVVTPGFSFEYTVDLNNCGPTLDLIRNAAIASAAFPLGLKPRALNRNRTDYDHRPIVLPPEGPGQPSKIAYLEPNWGTGFTCASVPAYAFVNFDGGCIDNSPFEWARSQLAGGLDKRNDRAGDLASRAVIIVDPFPQFGQTTPVNTEAGVPLHSAALTLLGVYKEHSRFSADEVALANDPDTYSRFLIAPVRPEPGINGAPDSQTMEGPWIASGALGGFSGFMSREYRLHDYQLGRRNCQQFLRANFTLSSDNPLFSQWKDKTWAAKYQVPGKAGTYELPVIPLMDIDPDHVEPLRPWPYNKFDPEPLRPQIKARATAIFDQWMRNQTFLANLARLAWQFWGKEKVTDEVVGIISKALQAQRLLPTDDPDGSH